jgi:hypothetical protein
MVSQKPIRPKNRNLSQKDFKDGEIQTEMSIDIWRLNDEMI